MINVTQTFLPDQKLYNSYLNHIWEKKWLTNHGQLSIELADKLRQYLDVKNIILTNNGTSAIQVPLRLLGSDYDVITTPFSYVATSAAIVWQNCNPVFVDIDPDYLCIDETLIEQAITPKTKAILATHVFGNPCNIEAIEAIAAKHNLVVIYDAAHAFGVKYKGRSIFEFGTISTCSFHATKIFHTAEGGAIFCADDELNEKLDYSTNFGHRGQYDFHGLGINAKMSELHAAMGLSVLPSMEHIFGARKKVVDLYLSLLDTDQIQLMKIREHTDWNWSYFPIILNDEESLYECVDQLQREGIFARRYFYPSLNTIGYLAGQKMPVAESVAKRILCLPLYVGLEPEDIHSICNVVNRCSLKVAAVAS